MQRGHIFRQKNGDGVRWREPDPASPSKHRLPQAQRFRRREFAKHWLTGKLDDVQQAGSSYRPNLTISELTAKLAEAQREGRGVEA